jgi:hypothetical protein
MMNFRTISPRLRGGSGGLLCAALALHAPVASAIDCSALPAPFYGQGGSAQRPLLARLGARLSALATPRTLVYQAPGACVGLNSLLNSTRITGSAAYWDAAGMERSCDLPVTGQVVDFASVGNQATLCPGVTALPAGVGEFEGPVTTWNFFVPTASSQRSISTEAAYFVFGFGRDGMAAPWTDEAAIIRRDANSAAQIVVSLATGVPVERFRGVDAMTNARSISLVAMATNAEAAIGFASGENVDANRAVVRTLAYQHTGQTCGYWPDSTATAFDKRGVREGLYWLWTTTRFYARVDASRQITNASVRDMVAWFTGQAAPPPEVPVLDLTIQNGNIPLCAMRVARTRDLGPLMSYAPSAPCGCYFERVATGSTACAACTSSSTCPASAPTCRNGFCEVN